MTTPFDISAFRRIWKSDILNADADFTHDLLQSNPLLIETLRLRKASVAIIDLQTMRYLCAIGNLEPIIGWSNEMVLQEGVPFFLSKLEKVDYLGLERMSSVMAEFVTKLDSNDVASFKSFFDFRMIRPNGQRVRILQEGVVLKQDAAGNILLLLALISDISHLKRSSRQHLRLGTQNADFLFEFDNQSLEFRQIESLSRREIEIAKLVGEKLTSKEIGDRLFISANTVNTHRQNIVKKIGMADMMEVNNFLMGYQLI